MDYESCSCQSLNTFNEFIIVSREQEHCTFDQPWSSSGLLDLGGVVIVVIFLCNVIGSLM